MKQAWQRVLPDHYINTGIMDDSPEKGFDHWEQIYRTKELNTLGWHQPTPAISLQLMEDCGVKAGDRIIDIGGGDSLLADHLISRGYRHLSVLDISPSSLERARERLGDQARQVEWIVSDITRFSGSHVYDCWHDRATFHFLINQEAVAAYMDVLRKHLAPGGVVIIGTFSLQGPKTCSGLPVHQYSEESMSALFAGDFSKIGCRYAEHYTPSGSCQHYVFCCFRRNA
jgi:ubiquinone/menaquinone biosynthesis C-methylase UbiE